MVNIYIEKNEILKKEYEEIFNSYFDTINQMHDLVEEKKNVENNAQKINDINNRMKSTMIDLYKKFKEYEQKINDDKDLLNVYKGQIENEIYHMRNTIIDTRNIANSKYEELFKEFYEKIIHFGLSDFYIVLQL